MALSVRDLVEAGPPQGHLGLSVVQTSQRRLAQARQAHVDLQEERQSVDAAYRPEVRVQRRMAIGRWSAVIHGRVDGLTEEDGRAVVEEIKSTTLDAGRLYATSIADWPDYVAQLEVYLWMLHGEGRDLAVGRLVLVSVSDGCRHVLGVPLDAAAVDGWVRARLEGLIEARERRLAWMAERRGYVVPSLFESWRPGQQQIVDAVEQGLTNGRQVLVEAPTGLGKTAAALTGALRHALAHDRIVFWATSRNTQQPHLQATLQRLTELGLPVRAVLISARERACLNDVVACRPDACAFAENYHDRVRERGLIPAASGRVAGPDVLRALGREHVVCPFELGLDASEHVDVIVGDYNYAFDPGVHLRRHFGDGAGQMIVVTDEVHQLVDRARAYGSPRIDAELARTAAERLQATEAYQPFAELAWAIHARIEQLIFDAPLGGRDGRAVAELGPAAFADLAASVDALGLDYALLALKMPAFEPGEPDAWVELARRVLRFQAVAEQAGDETVGIVDHERPAVALQCLDPSSWLGPWIGRLGGFVGLSATLSPPSFHRDLLGLDPERLDVLRVPSPFPPENRRIVVAPRVSTAWRDRAAHAAPTARLLQDLVEAVPGNVACYFPSFEMLRDITGRLSLRDRELLVQEPAMDESRRREHLARLSSGGRPVVLAAVLGGIFAEGVDLPPGALAGVLVAGPALPPVGLERDLLRAYYDERYGQGFRYASLVPGVTRVVQAAGRLIRRPEDRGVIVLLGRRFRWRDVAELLPEDWDLDVPDDPVAAVRAFSEEGAG